MKRAIRTRRLASWTGLTVATVALTGGLAAYAQQPASSQPAATGSAQVPPSTQPSAVKEAAWSHLQLLRNYVHASRLRDPQRRAAEFGKARRDLAAVASFPGHLKDEEIEAFSMLWPAAVAHYVDGFDKDRLIVVQTGENEAAAVIVATNPHDKEVADAVSAKIRADLQKQGFSGRNLDSREQVLLKRELARQGIGTPLAATIQLRMVKVDDQWRLQNVQMLVPNRRPAATTRANKDTDNTSRDRQGAEGSPASQP